MASPTGTDRMRPVARTLPPSSTWAADSASPKASNPTPSPEGDITTYFDCTPPADGTSAPVCHRTRKPTLNYAVTLIQPFYLRAANPEQPFLLTLQWSDSVVFGYDRTRPLPIDPATKQPMSSLCSDGSCLLEIPGYDSTLLTRHRYQLVAALSSTFLRGLVTPRIAGAWLPRQNGNSVTRGSGFVSLSTAFAFDDHWRMNVAVNIFAGADPYQGVGLFRDRDEVNVAVRYQF